MDHPPGNKSTKFLLDPIDRISEGLCGLIMALSFNCSISAAGAGREDGRTMHDYHCPWGIVKVVGAKIPQWTGWL